MTAPQTPATPSLLRPRAWLALFALLLLPSACRERYGQAMQPGPGSCQAIAWGGWNGTPECGGIATIVIAAEQRMCERDQDCTIVGQTRCSAHAVNIQTQAAASQYPPPCLNPLSLTCPAWGWTARCEQGCCVPRPSR